MKKVVDTVGDTEVGEESWLDGREDEHRAVGPATAVIRQKSGLAQIEQSGSSENLRRGTLGPRDSDGIVEGKAEQFMCYSARMSFWPM